MLNFITGGVCAAQGFRAGGIHVGVKTHAAWKKDVALIVSDEDCACAAVYTKNAVKAAHIHVDKRHLADGKARAAVINSGNANACAPQGEENAEKMCAAAAAAIGCNLSFAPVSDIYYNWHNPVVGLRTYGNLLVTMVLGGLWHGAAIRFILWGTLHGVALALHKLWMAVVPGAKASGAQMHWWSRAAGMLLTFNIVCLGWLMFRAESMQTVSLMLHQIFENFNAAMIPQVVTGYAAVFALIAAGYILHLLPSAVDAVAQRIVVHAPLVLQVLMAAAMIWCVMQIKSSDIQPFIYFQF